MPLFRQRRHCGGRNVSKTADKGHRPLGKGPCDKRRRSTKPRRGSPAPQRLGFPRGLRMSLQPIRLQERGPCNQIVCPQEEALSPRPESCLTVLLTFTPPLSTLRSALSPHLAVLPPQSPYPPATTTRLQGCAEPQYAGAQRWREKRHSNQNYLEEVSKRGLHMRR